MSTGSSPGIGKRARLAQLTGNSTIARLIRRVHRTPGVVCINYHRVAEDVEHDTDLISVTPAELMRQAEWLRREFRILNGTEMVEVMAGRLRLDRPAVALTFDDAYADNFAAGRLLMERLQVPATFFVPTAFIETGQIPPWDRFGYAVRRSPRSSITVPASSTRGPWTLDTGDYDTAMTRLMELFRSLPAHQAQSFVDAFETAADVRAPVESLFMSWSEIRQLADMGHDIGAHTHSHPVLASLSPEEQLQEVQRSRDILNGQLKRRVRLFAYPYGKPRTSFTDVTKQIVRDCGFDAAFSFYGGWNRVGRIDAYDVKRIKVDLHTSLPIFRTRVAARGLIPV